MHCSPLLLVASLGIASALPAQLAGSYLVGPGGNYPNIAAAMAALTTSGVVGPVTFLVTANDVGPWTLGAFAGQGPANPVVFDGQGTVTISGAQPVLTLNGCASVTFRGFSGTFTATPNSFLINTGTTDCVFSGCDFRGAVATTGAALFNFAGGSGCRIEDSTFGGAYEALYSAVGNSTTTVQRCQIIGGGWWIMRLGGSDFRLINNFITGTSNYGISAGISGAANGPNLKIWHNSVFINHPTSGSQYCSLRWYTTAPGSEVQNNVFCDFYPTTSTTVFNMWCLGTIRPALMDYNCMWSNQAGYTPVFASTNQTLASWQALGFDANSFQADPMYFAPSGTPPDLRLQPGSPCSTSGNTLAAVTTDYFQTVRTPPVSIGAHEASTSGGVFASRANYGNGCYRTGASFYELFQPNTFDLSNSSIQMIPAGGSYLVIAGSTNWYTPTSANLGLTDDSVSAAQTLPFTFNYPGGSTTQVWISSNGFVWLAASTAHGCCAGVVNDLLNGLPRICPIWGDLNPAAGGSVHFDVDPSNTAAYVTFDQVPEFGQTTALNSFQLMFDQSGLVELRYRTCSALTHTVLTGFSPGGGTIDTGNRDLSNVQTTPFLTGPEQLPLQLDASARPITGTTIQLATTNVPAGSTVGATILGLHQVNPPLELSLIGMPDCYQYASIDNINVFVVGSGGGTTPLTIPNNAALQGLHAYTQSLVFAPGANALGIVSSNGVDLRLGNL